jgi:succinate dehydrogenase/fumarate reductase flavoprotein subunit
LINAALTNVPDRLSPQFCDVLVLGGGVAAMQAAIMAARSGAKVRMVGMAKGASPYILGFNVPLDAAAGDTLEKFADDTFAGGYRLANRGLLDVMSDEVKNAFEDLVALGVPFEKSESGFSLRHLSGSRHPRSVYVKTGTGNAIHKALSAAVDNLGVTKHLGLQVVKLIKLADRVVGALAFHRHSNELIPFIAPNTVIALGGIGGLYHESTYPADVLGDSYALALNAGAVLVDMEFVQFEPTVVSYPESVRGMEMPTAMLGDGAIMKNALMERFMCRYNPAGCEKQIEKARMALCIQSEIDAGRGTPDGSVYFDATSLSQSVLEGYVTHYRRLVNAGVHPAKDLIAIKPAAHSLMGGIRIGADCRSDVDGLYACGEASGGIHGASRIAGNGATDAIVFGRVAGRAAAAADRPAIDSEAALLALAKHIVPLPGNDTGSATDYLARVRKIMSTHVGIRRSESGLLTAVQELRRIVDDTQSAWDESVLHPLASAHNAAQVGLAIAQSALNRKESRGAHFRIDHPQLDDIAWQRSIGVRLDARGTLKLLKI